MELLRALCCPDALQKNGLSDIKVRYATDNAVVFDGATAAKLLFVTEDLLVREPSLSDRGEELVIYNGAPAVLKSPRACHLQKLGHSTTA